MHARLQKESENVGIIELTSEVLTYEDAVGSTMLKAFQMQSKTTFRDCMGTGIEARTTPE